MHRKGGSVEPAVLTAFATAVVCGAPSLPPLGGSETSD